MSSSVLWKNSLSVRAARENTLSCCAVQESAFFISCSMQKHMRVCSLFAIAIVTCDKGVGAKVHLCQLFEEREVNFCCMAALKLVNLVTKQRNKRTGVLKEAII